MDATGDDTSDVTPALVALTKRQAAELAELRERVGRAEGDAVAARAELERVQAAHVIELGCVFRRKAAGHSDASQPVIPTETSHSFRGNPATPDPG